MTVKNYSLYKLRHDLIDEPMRTVQEDKALKVLDQWYNGTRPEKGALLSLIRLGVIENDR